MKRTFSIAFVAAVALAATGSYMAHAELDGSRLPSANRRNHSTELRQFKSNVAGAFRNVSVRFREIKRDIGPKLPGGSAAFFAANDAHFLYYAPVTRYAHETCQRIGANMAEAMLEAEASNESYSGVWATKTREGSAKITGNMDKVVGRTTSRLGRGLTSLCNLINKREDTGVTLSCDPIGSCGQLTPYPSSFYSHDYRDSQVYFTVTIPSSRNFGICYVSAAWRPFSSGTVAISGGQGGGSGSLFADAWGAAWGSASVSGTGNMRLHLLDNGTRCGSQSITLCPGSGLVDSK